MRKLKLQVQISVDGFIAGPQGEMDWLVQNWGPDIDASVSELTDSVDTVLLGANLAKGFIPHWTAASKEENPIPGAEFYANVSKVVFSNSIQESDTEVQAWQNKSIANGNLVEEVKALKALAGKDMIAYGGSAFVSSLIQHQLIDELYLFVNPTALGKGLPIFASLTKNQHLQLIDTKQFDCGIVLLAYKIS